MFKDREFQKALIFDCLIPVAFTVAFYETACWFAETFLV